MIKNFLKNNFWTIILAVMLGFIYFLPNILIPRLLAKEGNYSYHLLNLEAPVLDEVGSYGVKIKELLEGKQHDGDPYVAEYKNYPTVWGNYYMAWLVGKILLIFQAQSPVPLFIVGDFFFPALSFVLAFYIFYILTKHRQWSYLSALVLIAYPNLSALLWFGKHETYQSVATFLDAFSRLFDGDFTRLLVPAFSFPFFLAAILALLCWLEKNTRVWLWTVGLTTGLLFYIYFYYWMFWTISLGILFLVFLLRRQLAMVRSFFKIGVISLIVSAPFWLNFYQLSQSPAYQVLRLRAGLVMGRFLDYGSWDNYVIIGLALLITGLAVKRGVFNKNFFSFLFSILLATLVVINLQVIFGFNPQPDHWGSRVNIYILVLALMLGVFYFFKLKNFSTLTRYLPLIIIPALLMVGLWSKTTYAMISKYDYLVFPDVIKSYQWINEHIPTDQVLVSPSTKTNIALPFFTVANIYAPPINFSVAPADEITNRFLEAYRVFAVPPEFLKNNLATGVAAVDQHTLFAKRRLEFDPLFFLRGDLDKTLGGYNYQLKNRYPDQSIVVEIINQYTRLTMPMNRLTFQHRADYIYNGPYEKLFGRFNPKKFNNLEKVYDQNLVQIYKIN